MFYVRARAIICLVVWYYLLFIQLNWSFMLHGSGALKTPNLQAHSSAVTARTALAVRRYGSYVA